MNDISSVIGFNTPTGTHTLLWLTVLVMSLDVVWGYLIARLRGEARSNRLREGIYRRIYMLTLLLVLTVFAALNPALFVMEIANQELNAVWFFYVGTIAAELKSLSEKAEQLGIVNHPVITALKQLIGRWTNGKS